MQKRPGTITQISPQDGLGWITLDDGTAIRFGGTACRKDVQITLGARVGVIGTAPGYGGVTKALTVVPLEPPAAPQPKRRTHLANLLRLGLPVDDTLRKIAARSDEDDVFHADLDRLGFELEPMLAEEIDCRAPAFFVMAMDGCGSAFGVYQAEGVQGLPWVFWEHEDDTLRFIAPDTASFFAGLVAYWQPMLKDPNPALRMRAVFAELGVALPEIRRNEMFLEGLPAEWLPQGPLEP